MGVTDKYQTRRQSMVEISLETTLLVVLWLGMVWSSLFRSLGLLADRIHHVVLKVEY